MLLYQNWSFSRKNITTDNENQTCVRLAIRHDSMSDKNQVSALEGGINKRSVNTERTRCAYQNAERCICMYINYHAYIDFYGKKWELRHLIYPHGLFTRDAVWSVTLLNRKYVVQKRVWACTVADKLIDFRHCRIRFFRDVLYCCFFLRTFSSKFWERFDK